MTVIHGAPNRSHWPQPFGSHVLVARGAIPEQWSGLSGRLTTLRGAPGHVVENRPSTLKDQREPLVRYAAPTTVHAVGRTPVFVRRARARRSELQVQVEVQLQRPLRTLIGCAPCARAYVYLRDVAHMGAAGSRHTLENPNSAPRRSVPQVSTTRLPN